MLPSSECVCNMQISSNLFGRPILHCQPFDNHFTAVSTNFDQLDNIWRTVYRVILQHNSYWFTHLTYVGYCFYELGLKTIYTTDQEFALHARMLYGLAYVPAADVPTALEIIRSTMPAVGHPLVQYQHMSMGPLHAQLELVPTTSSIVHPCSTQQCGTWPTWHDLPTTNNHVEATSSIFSVFEMLSKYKIITIIISACWFSAFWFFCHLIFCLLNSAFWLSAF